MTAHLVGSSFGFHTANVSLSMAGQRTIQHGWRSHQGWIGSASFGFTAPAASGTWTAHASGDGEVPLCIDGQIGWRYGGAGSRQLPLEVSGATLYLASAGRPDTPEVDLRPSGFGDLQSAGRRSSDSRAGHTQRK